MQHNPLVTVICLCYNHDAFVQEALNAVLNQEYQPLELIVVDDASTDGSKNKIEAWLEQHPNCHFIANRTNLGPTKSFNQALQLAKGSYILDLATDDVLLANAIQLQVAAFEKSKFQNVGVVYGNASLVLENGTFDSYYFPVSNDEKVLTQRVTGFIYCDVLSGGASICSVSALVKKSVYDALGGYDENLAFEDLDFWIRASRVYEFDFIDAVLIKKRIVARSLGSQFATKNHAVNQSMVAILKKAFHLNRSKTEDAALQKRVHYELIQSFQKGEFVLFCNHFWLRIQLQFRRF